VKKEILAINRLVLKVKKEMSKLKIYCGEKSTFFDNLVFGFLRYVEIKSFCSIAVTSTSTVFFSFEFVGLMFVTFLVTRQLFLFIMKCMKSRQPYRTKSITDTRPCNGC
jgi:hypothetical protein